MPQLLDDADLWLSPPQFHSNQTPPFTFNNAWRCPEADREENDIYVELNRRFNLSESRNVDLRKPSEVSKSIGGSPQSILGGIGNWSGRSSNQSPLQGSSPTATPCDVEYDATRLIYAAAGQVNQLKMSCESTEQNHVPVAQNHKASFVDEQNYLAAARRAYNAALLYEHHLQILANSAKCTKPVTGVRSDLLTESPRFFLQQHQPRVCNKSSAPLQQKRESVGTGVFLPRRYNTSPATPLRKRDVVTNAIVPDKVVQALNVTFEEMNYQPDYSAYAASMSYKSYEALMAKRNAFLAQQQQSLARAVDHVHSNLEACLPQEWSY